jgi:hypothetical protein
MLIPQTISVLMAAAPNPDTSGGLPGGAEAKLNTLLGWFEIIGYVCGVAGVIGVAIMLIMQHRRGQGGEHAFAFACVCVGCLLIGAATGVVDAMTTA